MPAPTDTNQEPWAEKDRGARGVRKRMSERKLLYLLSLRMIISVPLGHPPTPRQAGINGCARKSLFPLALRAEGLHRPLPVVSGDYSSEPRTRSANDLGLRNRTP